MSDSLKKIQQAAIDEMQKRSASLNAESIADALLAGDRAALSQAITLVESNTVNHQILASQLISICLSHSGKSMRIGITGVPGVGKSTFVEALGLYLLSIGKKVAVLAIDPTSPLSHGSILGDKTRMANLSQHANAYIRPSASALAEGGVARKTKEAMVLCEAAGFDVIIVETLGAGQGDTTVYGMVDFFLLLMLAGAGDQLQGIKRGIVELADAILITKADDGNEKNAIRARAEYNSALHLYPPKPNGWVPKVEVVSAIKNHGIENTWATIEAHQVLCISSGYLETHRKDQNLEWMRQTIRHELLHRFFSDTAKMEQMKKLEHDVLVGRISPFEAARKALDEN